MDEKIRAYLELAAAQIRWKRARVALMEELETHLLEQKAACMADGMEEAEATGEALRQMGDPVAVGKGLDCVHRPAPSWTMMALAILLAAAGCAMRLFFQDEGRSAGILLTAAVGLAVLLGVQVLDVARLGRHGVLAYVGIVALGVTALWLSPQHGGASYYGRAVVSLYPVAYALLVFALGGRGWGGLLLTVAGMLPLMVLAAAAPSILGMLMVVGAACLVLPHAVWRGWFRVGKRAATLFLIGLAAAFAALLLLQFHQGIANRIAVALNPMLEPEGRGYQSVLVRQLLSGAKLWGPGALPAALERAPLPGGDTDYLPALLIHRFGWIPFLLLCLCLLGLLAVGLLRGRRQPGMLGRMLSAAILLPMAMQTAACMLSNLGVVLLGAGCPFVAGNLQMLLDLFLTGILLAVFRQERLPEQGKPRCAGPGTRRVLWRDGQLVVSFRKTGAV